jgi:Protein of unknown function (DUF3754)
MTYMTNNCSGLHKKAYCFHVRSASFLSMRRITIAFLIGALASETFAFQSSHQPTSRLDGDQRRAQPLIIDSFACTSIDTTPRNTSDAWSPWQDEVEQLGFSSAGRVLRNGSESFINAGIFDLKQNGIDNKHLAKASSYVPGLQSSIEGGDLVCRVIARSDGKFPPVEEILPLLDQPDVLQQIDDIFHAQAHQETRSFKYMQRSSKTNIDPSTQFSKDGISLVMGGDALEEQRLVMTTRRSLEDAGFELLSRRDLDLCEALNSGYLLRLSILPDVAKLDKGIAKEFFPERFSGNGTVLEKYKDDFLFDQRVLVFWRGYSKEVTRGRLLLPKLDYLQASLVQRLFGKLREQMGHWERNIALTGLSIYRKATACFISYMRQMADQIPNQHLSKRLRRAFRSPYFYSAFKVLNNGTLPSVAEMKASAAKRGNVFKLSRYGGSETKFVGSPNPTDALTPFIICEEKDNFSNGDLTDKLRVQKIDRVMYESLNRNEVCCPYDSKESSIPPMQLLERVSISNLVDVFTKEGRRNFVKTMLSKSELVEPTYEEVVVVWRPLSENTNSSKFAPPQIAYELADMFDIEGLPRIQKEADTIPIAPLQIRTFEDVPMANLPAVLPQTKLIFRPADAFVFDLISIFSFVAIAGSIRFDNPKLDLIALVSVGLWFFRTVLRYSNKLARYDLLVKKFLTSKISHRNSGALKYLATEAGSQKAVRAAFAHLWLRKAIVSEKPLSNDGLKVAPLFRSQLISEGNREICASLNSLKRMPIDVDAALRDLEDLQLVRRIDGDGQLLEVIHDESSVFRALKNSWRSLLERSILQSKKSMVRSRIHNQTLGHYIICP